MNGPEIDQRNSCLIDPCKDEGSSKMACEAYLLNKQSGQNIPGRTVKFDAMSPLPSRQDAISQRTESTECGLPKNTQDTSKQAIYDRAAYLKETMALVKNAALSSPVQAGEGYHQVLSRSYPALSGNDLLSMSQEVLKLNGGRKPLHQGERIKLLSHEQQLRLIDKIMNDYDARHNTDALDIYGDFSPEKGRLASAHEQVRRQAQSDIENLLIKKFPDKSAEKTPEKKTEPEKMPVPDSPKESTKPVAMSEFVQKALSILPELDIDGNSYLSRAELLAASKDDKYSDEEKQVVDALLASEKAIKKLSNDQFLSEAGITCKDLSKLGESIEDCRRDYNEAKNLEERFRDPRLFAGIDSDRNDLLSRKEIESALNLNHELKQAEKNALLYMADKYHRLIKVSDDEKGRENSGLSKFDIAGALQEVKGRKEAGLVSAIGRAVLNRYFEKRRSQESLNETANEVKPQSAPANSDGKQPQEASSAHLRKS